jgi:dsDNA-binding SOS-regulon protein
LAALVIATKKIKTSRITYFVSKKEGKRFDRIITAINVIAEKEVLRVWGKAALLEETEEIVELTMDVATDGDRRREIEKCAFLEKNIVGHAEEGDEKTLFDRAMLADVLDKLVQVHGGRRGTFCSEGDENGHNCHRLDRVIVVDFFS